MATKATAVQRGDNFAANRKVMSPRNGRGTPAPINSGNYPEEKYFDLPSGLIFSKVAEKLEKVPLSDDVICHLATLVELGSMSPNVTVNDGDDGLSPS